MSKYMASKMRSPTDPAHIGWQQNYPYAMQWLGLHGGFKGATKVKPTHPMLYIYGARKPFMFHSSRWLETLSARPDCQVEGFATGHWVMSQEPARFNQVVGQWLAKA
jgi:cis-3-alkyl-4-acyloxetan-2-one decarboxylase